MEHDTWIREVTDSNVPENIKKIHKMMVNSGFSSNITPEVNKKRIESLLEDSIKEFSTQAGWSLTFIPFGLGIPTLYPIINAMVEDMIDIAFKGDKGFSWKKEKFLKDVKDYIPGLVASIPALLIPGVGIAVAKTTVKNIGNDFKRAIISYI